MRCLTFTATLFSLISYLASTNSIPVTFGGTGVILDNKLFYFGSLQNIAERAIEQKHLNKEVFYIDLKEGLELSESDKANWKIIDLKNHPLDTLMSAQTITKNDNLKEIMVVGGSFTSINESEVGQGGSNYIKNLFILEAKKEYDFYGPSYATITQNDINPDKVILFGGICALTSSINSTIVESLRNLVVYNIKENSWKTIKEKAYDYAIDHTSIIYNGVLMVLNRRVSATVDFTGFKDILCFDLKNEKWFNKTTSGEIPEALYGSSSIKVDNQFYIVGGVINHNQTIYQSSLVYSLDLDHFTWKKHAVLELISAMFSFLVHYNNYLVYSFRRHIGLSFSKTHIINFKTFTLVNKIPSQSELESLKSKSKVVMVVGSTIGGLNGLILLTIITYFAIKKIKGAIILRRIPDYVPEPTSNG